MGNPSPRGAAANESQVRGVNRDDLLAAIVIGLACGVIAGIWLVIW